MFFLNVGHRWNVAEALESLRAAIYPASAAYSERLLRTPLPDFRRRLLDPQLYLAGLDVTKCSKVCARLASYPWFCVPNVPDFDSGEQTRTGWQKSLAAKIKENWPCKPPEEPAAIAEACRAAIEVQLNIGCTHVILPSPLIVEREDEAAVQAAWLDVGLEKVEEIGVSQPVLASIPLAESTLNSAAFSAGGFLDTVVDQVASRENLAGAYIVVAQTAARHPFETESLVIRAYLHLCREFAARDYEFIIPNFADVASLMCMAVGASNFATGPSHSLRRLSLAAFLDDGGGNPLPYFYSHSMAAELLTETDLDRIAANRLLSRVRDLTEFSEPLMRALSAGRSAASIPAWAESKNNLSTAHKHFVQRMLEEEKRTRRLPVADRVEGVRDWLETSAANQLYVQTKLDDKGEELKGRLIPADRWLAELDTATGS